MAKRGKGTIKEGMGRVVKLREVRGCEEGMFENIYSNFVKI